MSSVYQGESTATAIQTETVTGSHYLIFSDYSQIQGVGSSVYVSSEVFSIGGYEWAIQFYPEGDTHENSSYITFFLQLKTAVSLYVRARFTFIILQPNGAPSGSNMTRTSGMVAFGNDRSLGPGFFVKRTEFEASECLKDDVFTLKCTVTVLKNIKRKKVSPYRVNVPMPNLNQNLADLLESRKGADVTFVVKGERFNAHRCVLAARSAVFSAELLGCMKEKWQDTITVDDIDPLAFKSMLHFIYSDSLPDFEGKQDLKIMAQHLLVAADRYGLDRLRLMCEDILSTNLCVCNAVPTLILADQHNCSQLKSQCIEFMNSFEVFKGVALTGEFHKLVEMEICPSIFKDGRAKCRC